MLNTFGGLENGCVVNHRGKYCAPSFINFLDDGALFVSVIPGIDSPRIVLWETLICDIMFQ